MTLTRLQFYTACKAFLDTGDSNPASDAFFKRYSEGWSWKEHDLFPELGYLSRSVLLLGNLRDSRGYSASDYPAELLLEVEIQEDNASAEQSSEEVLTCKQYVVYSPTFQIPALYFSVHRPNGVALTLAEIVRTSLFHSQALPTTVTNYAIDAPESSFAMLSQGDHPILGIPCWYLHPCHTAEMVEEIMKEAECDDPEQRWLKAWFTVLGNVVDFRTFSGDA